MQEVLCRLRSILSEVLVLTGYRLHYRGQFTLSQFCSCAWLQSASCLDPYGNGMGSNGDWVGILLLDAGQPVPVLWLFKEC